VNDITNDETPGGDDGRSEMDHEATDRCDARTLEVERLQSRRRLVELAVFGALIAGAIVALPGLGDLRGRLAAADPALVALAAGLEVGSCLAFVVAFRGVFSGRLGWRFSYEVAMSEQAANVLLPTGGAGGLALGAWALRRLGMPAELIGRRTVAFFLITSSVNFAAVILAGLALALGLLPGEVAIPLALIPAALAIGAFGVVALIPRLLDARAGARTDGRLRRALAAAGLYLTGGVRDAGRLLGSGRPAILLGAIGYMALDVLALGAMFAALGGEAPTLGVFVLAYALGQLGGVIPLPGGIGGTDGGLVAAFALLGTSIAVATAAVLAYRLFQLGVPAILGLAAFGQLRRRLGADGTAAEPSAPLGALEPQPA
jgi:uncharacterized membrane protein YbhN (UPF0104 family)